MRAWSNVVLPQRLGIRLISATARRHIDLRNADELLKLVEDKRCLIVSNITELATDDLIRFKFEKYGEIEKIIRPYPRMNPPVFASLPRIKSRPDTYLYVVFSKPETASKVLEAAARVPFQFDNRVYSVTSLTKVEAKNLHHSALRNDLNEVFILDDTITVFGLPAHLLPEDISREFSKYGTIIRLYLEKPSHPKQVIRKARVKFVDPDSIQKFFKQTGDLGAFKFADDWRVISAEPSRLLAQSSPSLAVTTWVLHEVRTEPTRLQRQIPQHLNNLLESNGLPAKFKPFARYVPPAMTNFSLRYFPNFEVYATFDSIDSAKQALQVLHSHSRTRPGWVLEAAYKWSDLLVWREEDPISKTGKQEDVRAEHSKGPLLKVPGPKDWGSTNSN